MKVVPVGDHVVVRKFCEEPAEAGELAFPNGYQPGPAEGRVVSVGDGRRLPCGERAHPRVGEGDRVLYHHNSGTEFQIGGQDLLILTEDEILAVLE